MFDFGQNHICHGKFPFTLSLTHRQMGRDCTGMDIVERQKTVHFVSFDIGIYRLVNGSITPGSVDVYSKYTHFDIVFELTFAAIDPSEFAFVPSPFPIRHTSLEFDFAFNSSQNIIQIHISCNRSITKQKCRIPIRSAFWSSSLLSFGLSFV